ncbi:hypothetical protein OG698_01505 [Streptomyces sp. NBC_01003]|uniref:hypothetical protein n=1 Tax=Streptomyces sp. NBC_01003 TaxID=2903714 RepID=UPI00386BB6A8|nr:hypothetical protein OG698_01505 [Streptomyces sp. NBC_01003]
MAELVHECGDQVVLRLCGEVFSEPVDREPLAEAADGSLLFQVKKLVGVDGSGGVGKLWGRVLPFRAAPS